MGSSWVARSGSALTHEACKATYKSAAAARDPTVARGTLRLARATCAAGKGTTSKPWSAKRTGRDAASTPPSARVMIADGPDGIATTTAASGTAIKGMALRTVTTDQ